MKRRERRGYKKKAYQKVQTRQPNELVFDPETDRFLPYSFIGARDRQRKESTGDEKNKSQEEGGSSVARFLSRREFLGRLSPKKGLSEIERVLKSKAANKALRTPDYHANQVGYGCAETLLGVLRKKL